MHKSHQKSKAKRSKKVKVSGISSVKYGTVSQPAVNSGTVQIPRTIQVRNQHVRRVFKQDYTVSTGTSASVFFGASLYAPFYATNTSTTSYSMSYPPGFTDMLGAFGLYKPKRVQLVIQPLVTMATIPSPYTVAMTFDITATNSLSTSVQTLVGYQNSTKVDPTFPSEVGYWIPKAAAPAGDSNNTVLSGGWIDSTSGTAPGLKGLILLTQNAPITVSTPYSIITLVYEVWFKNAN